MNQQQTAEGEREEKSAHMETCRRIELTHMIALISMRKLKSFNQTRVTLLSYEQAQWVYLTR